MGLSGRFDFPANLLARIRPPGDIRFPALSVALGLLTFLLGFLLTFPNHTLRDRLEYELSRRLPAEFSLERASLAFPPGVAIGNVRIRPQAPAIPELRFDEIKIFPHLSTLYGRPGASFAITSGAGRVAGEIDAGGTLAVDIERYQLDQAIPGFSSLRLSGLIGGSRIETHLDPEPDKRSIINLRATGIALVGAGDLGLAADRLPLGDLELDVEGSGRTFTLVRGALTGGDILAEASGRVVVGRTVAATRADLELLIRAGSGLDPSVGGLLELLGSADSNGGRRVRIRGPLARPNIF